MNLTREQRTAEFLRLFNTIEGTNVQRIRVVCKVLQYAEITVRQYLMRQPVRVPSERDLNILRDGLAALKK